MGSQLGENGRNEKKWQQRQDSWKEELELKEGVVYFVSVFGYINGLLNSGPFAWRYGCRCTDKILITHLNEVSKSEVRLVDSYVLGEGEEEYSQSKT